MATDEELIAALRQGINLIGWSTDAVALVEAAEAAVSARLAAVTAERDAAQGQLRDTEDAYRRQHEHFYRVLAERDALRSQVAGAEALAAKMRDMDVAFVYESSHEIAEFIEAALGVHSESLGSTPATPTGSKTAGVAVCPTCGAPYGFHDDEPHAEAVARIPEHLMERTSTSTKRERSAEKHAANRAFLSALSPTTGAPE